MEPTLSYCPLVWHDRASPPGNISQGHQAKGFSARWVITGDIIEAHKSCDLILTGKLLSEDTTQPACLRRQGHSSPQLIALPSRNQESSVYGVLIKEANYTLLPT